MKISYIKMLEYFFYKDYMFNKMIKHSDSLIVSVMMICLVEFFNILALFDYVGSSFFHLKQGNTISMIGFLAIGVIQFFLNFRYFMKNEVRICNKYRGESLLKSILGYTFYVSYYIGSFALVIIVHEHFHH
jgi:hypothetical protein